MMFTLMPQSMASTFQRLPLPYTLGAVMDTSATRLRWLTSTNSCFLSPPSTTAFSNSMRALREPFSRIFLVSKRVSRP